MNLYLFVLIVTNVTCIQTKLII